MHNVPVYGPAGLNDTWAKLGVLPVELSPRFGKGGTIEPFGPNGPKITAVHAEHSSEYTWKNPATNKDEVVVGGEPVGFILEMENGFKIWHMGDTAVFGDMRLIGDMYRPDLVLVPIGGHFVMNPAGCGDGDARDDPARNTRCRSITARSRNCAERRPNSRRRWAAARCRCWW